MILAAYTWYWRCARDTGGVHVILALCTGGVHVILAVCTWSWRCARGTGGVHVVLVARAVACSLAVMIVKASLTVCGILNIVTRRFLCKFSREREK